MSVRRAPAVEPTRAAGPNRLDAVLRAGLQHMPLLTQADTDMTYGVDSKEQRQGRIEDRGAAAKAARAAELARRRAQESSSDDDSDEEIEENEPVIGIDYKELSEDVVEDLFGANELPMHFYQGRRDLPNVLTGDGANIVTWGDYRRTSMESWQKNDNKSILDYMQKVEADEEFQALTKNTAMGRMVWTFAWDSFADMVAWALHAQDSPRYTDRQRKETIVATYKRHNILMGMVKNDAKEASGARMLSPTLRKLLNDALINIIMMMPYPGSKMDELMKNVKRDPESGLIGSY
jgi:hypothetical protein